MLDFSKLQLFFWTNSAIVLFGASFEFKLDYFLGILSFIRCYALWHISGFVEPIFLGCP
jgi:hypothetical protein